MNKESLTRTRILLKLLLAAVLIIILLLFSSTDVDFIYTGF